MNIPFMAGKSEHMIAGSSPRECSVSYASFEFIKTHLAADGESVDFTLLHVQFLPVQAHQRLPKNFLLAVALVCT